MHISEGVLALPVLLAGAGASAAGIAVGLRKMRAEHVPRVALLAAAFFVATLVHLPVGPAKAHLILNGLMGFVLGWAAFPAIFVGLVLQALLFQYGGITTLGVNTWNMAFPAVLCSLLFSPWIRGTSPRLFLAAAFLCGALSVALSGISLAACLVLSGDDFVQVARIVLWVHLPVMGVDGVLTAMICGFLRQVKPELLRGAGIKGGSAT